MIYAITTTRYVQTIGVIFNCLKCTKGIIRFHNECSKCKTKKHYKYFSALRCVSTVDVMHILLAKELGCNSFVTFDRDLKRLFHTN